MKIKTKAIVLNNYKYSDNSSIIHLYSEDYGRIAAIYRVKAKKKHKQRFLQVLQLLELELKANKNNKLFNIIEANNLYQLSGIIENPIKSAVAFFIADFLHLILQEEISNTEIFNFVENFILDLNIQKNNLSNFHLNFLIAFTFYLGIQPEINFDGNNKYFSYNSGKFIAHEDYYTVSYADSELLYNLLLKKESMLLTNNERKSILNLLIKYYTYHFDILRQMKSVKVLEDLFS